MKVRLFAPVFRLSLRQKASGASTPCEPPDVSHLSQVSRKLTNAWKHPDERPERAGCQQHTRARARTHALPLPHVRAPTQTCNHLVCPDSSQIALCCLSSLVHLPPPSAVFAPVSPSSLWMPSLPLTDLLRPHPPPPRPLASRWGKDNTTDACIKLYTILWRGTGGVLGGGGEGGGIFLNATFSLALSSSLFFFFKTTTFMRGQPTLFCD